MKKMSTVSGATDSLRFHLEEKPRHMTGLPGSFSSSRQRGLFPHILHKILTILTYFSALTTKSRPPLTPSLEPLAAPAHPQAGLTVQPCSTWLLCIVTRHYEPLYSPDNRYDV